MKVKSKKRLLSVIFAFALMMSAFSMHAFAEGAIATVNGTEYSDFLSLIGAVNAEAGPVEIKFLQDVTLPEALEIMENQDITIDLNGRTVTADVARYMITNNGKLTIKGDGTAYNTCIDKQGCGVILNERTGTLTIENGTFGSSGTRGIAVWNWGTAVLNGGSYTACDNYTPNEPENNGFAYAIVNREGTMTLEDGVSVSGKMNGALAADGGKLIVNGGTYTLGDGTDANLYYMIYTSGNGEVEVNGGTFTRNATTDYGFIYGTGDVNINDGTFVDKVNNHIKFGHFGTVNIYGGTFSGEIVKDSATSLVISGGTFPDADVTGYFNGGQFCQLEDGTVVKAVAAVNSFTYYPSLAAAVEAAESGNWVTLLCDTSGSGIVVPSGKNLTIDLQTNTYTVVDPLVGSSETETNGFQLLKDSDIALQNGTIKVGTTNAKMLIQNYSNLTLRDITLDGTMDGSNIQYVLSNNNGATRLRGNTNIIAPAGQVAFDVYYWPKAGYESVSVTVDENMTGKITGRIKYSDDETEDDSVVAENAIISIAGGTFSEPVNPDFCAPGFAPTQNADGEYTVVKEEYAAEIDGEQYKTLEEAFSSVQSGSATIKLLKSISGCSRIDVAGKDIKLDLNGFDIGFAQNQYFLVHGYGRLYLTGEGKVYEEARYFAPVMQRGMESGTNTSVVVVDKNVTLEGWAGIFIDKYSGGNSGISTTVYGRLVSRNDIRGAGGHALYVNGSIQTMSEGAVKILLDGATITNAEGGNGMYLAGYADTTIINSAIDSSVGNSTGIEIRAGKLNITNSSVKGGSGAFDIVPNGNGSTTSNVALAVVQHTTKLPLEVTINSGTFEATASLFEQNAQNNDEEAVAKIKLDVKDGTFNGVVYSENKEDFISGGTFDTKPSIEYCAPGYAPVANDEGKYVVEESPAVLTDDGADAIIADDGTGTIRFVTKVKSLSGVPKSYGTYMVPLDIFNKDGLGNCVTVT